MNAVHPMFVFDEENTGEVQASWERGSRSLSLPARPNRRDGEWPAHAPTPADSACQGRGVLEDDARHSHAYRIQRVQVLTI